MAISPRFGTLAFPLSQKMTDSPRILHPDPEPVDQRPECLDRFPRTHFGSEQALIDLQGRLRPGRMLLVDTAKKVLVRDEELKLEIARLRPLRKWLRTEVIHLEHLHRDYQVNTDALAY